MKAERVTQYYRIDEQRILRILFSGERNGEIPVQIEAPRRGVRTILWDISRENGNKILMIREFAGKTTLSLTNCKEYKVLIHAKNLHELWNIFQEIGMGMGLYRETERSVWLWKEKEHSFRIIFDYWPGIEPLLSLEGCPLERLESVEEKLCLPDKFEGSVVDIYQHMYGIDINKIEYLNAEYIESIKRLNYLI